MKKIALIATGGTIAMIAVKEAGGGEPQLNSEAMINAVPAIKNIADIYSIDLFSKPSASLSFFDFVLLHDKILELSKLVDGIVITHGTDVMEEVAFGLSLLLVDISVPVVITGAMRRADMPGADGPANLTNAVQVAAHESSIGKGVLLVMNGDISSGFTVKKQHSFKPDAFSGQPIGHVAEDRVRFFFKPIIPRLNLKLGNNQIRLLNIEGGFASTVENLSAVDFSKLDAFITSITGAGHISEQLVGFYGEIAGNIPTVFSSRTGSGETLRGYYAFRGSETDLISRGLIPSGYLNARQARMLMLVANSNVLLSIEETRALFQTFNS